MLYTSFGHLNQVLPWFMCPFSSSHGTVRIDRSTLRHLVVYTIAFKCWPSLPCRGMHWRGERPSPCASSRARRGSELPNANMKTSQFQRRGAEPCLRLVIGNLTRESRGVAWSATTGIRPMPVVPPPCGGPPYEAHSAIYRKSVSGMHYGPLAWMGAKERPLAERAPFLDTERRTRPPHTRGLRPRGRARAHTVPNRPTRPCPSMTKGVVWWRVVVRGGVW